MANDDRNSGVRDNDLRDSESREADENPVESDSRNQNRVPTNSSLSSSSRSSSTEGGRKEESGFSFKHFLKTSGDSSTSSNLNGSTTPSKLALRNNPSSSTVGSSNQSPQNLGARPKVPQYSMHNGIDQQLPRMKRSPKFPSFDSHASLSEYSEEVSSSFVQRSHSNYEVETPSAATFNRRSPVNQSTTGQSREPPPSSVGNCNSPSGNGPPSSARNTSELSSALPDFVKDHMVFEQWYQTNPFRADSTNDLSGGSSPPSGEAHPIDLEPSPRRNYHNSNLFDLALASSAVTGGGGLSSTFRLATNSPTVPLDLPATYDGNNHLVGNERIQIPLDLPHHRFSIDRHSNPSNPVADHLPLDLTDRHRVNSRNDIVGMRDREESPPPQVQADMIQTLPDFLSDGPIHSSGRFADVAQDLPQLDSPEENAAVNVISRLRLENDRLRHELDEARRLISDQGRQINDLERSCRIGEIQRNGTVLESNKLKQKIAQLTEEVDTLRHENESLREEDGAVGGNPSDCNRDKEPQRRPLRCQQLSRELKVAASTAEANLRQLLAGVGNLRLLASRVEGMDQERDPIEDYISDCEEDDFLGGGGGPGL